MARFRIGRLSRSGLVSAALMVALGGVLLSGCGEAGGDDLESSHGSGGTLSSANRTSQPPVVKSVEIIPNPAKLSAHIATRVDASDPEGERITYRWQWYVNGQAVPGETGPVLTPQRVSRGDQVSVEVTPMDTSGEGRSKMSELVPVVNSSPEVTLLEVTPDVLRVGESVSAQAQGTDADGDLVDFTFRWYRNNQVLPEAASNTLALHGFRRGDTLVVEAVPHDSMSDGKPAFSREYPLNNGTPKISSIPSGNMAGGQYRYQVTASDPDGDPLTYALVSGPEGMTIDSGTGLVQWRVPARLSGRYSVTVSVEDGQGGRATQQFELAAPP